MAGFTCTITDADGTKRTSSHRGMSGARKVAANLMLDRARGVLTDEAAWAPRTTKKLREEAIEHVNHAEALLAWDGPTNIVLPDGVTIDIATAPDDEQPRTSTRKRERKAISNKEARWLSSARFANDCACGCGKRVAVGSETFYVPGVGVYLPDHAPATAPPRPVTA